MLHTHRLLRLHLQATPTTTATPTVSLRRETRTGGDIPVGYGEQLDYRYYAYTTGYYEPPVKPKPNFRIVSYTEPENIIIGKRDVVLHVFVENIGSENAESVGLRIANKTEEIFVSDESRVF
jgi:hypothetical protein